jgi:hypothetical protein
MFILRLLIIISGYVVLLKPAGWAMDRLTASWQKDLQQHLGQGLPRAGYWIGCLERALVLTFALLGQYQAIGFLIAAKSILRFGEVSGSKPENRKMSEYVIIGTFASLLMAILVSVGVLTLIHLPSLR